MIFPSHNSREKIRRNIAITKDNNKRLDTSKLKNLNDLVIAVMHETVIQCQQKDTNT